MSCVQNKLNLKGVAIIGDSRLKYAHTCVNLLPENTPIILFKKGAMFHDLGNLLTKLPSNTSKILIHAGINDVMSFKSAEYVFLNLKELLRRIRNTFPNAEILISEIGPIGYDYYVNGFQQDYINFINLEVLRFKNLLKDFVKECTQFKILTYSAFHSDFLAKDGLHYSKTGISNVIKNVFEFFTSNCTSRESMNELVTIQNVMVKLLHIIMSVSDPLLTTTQIDCLNGIIQNFEGDSSVVQNEFPSLSDVNATNMDSLSQKPASPKSPQSKANINKPVKIFPRRVENPGHPSKGSLPMMNNASQQEQKTNATGQRQPETSTRLMNSQVTVSKNTAPQRIQEDQQIPVTNLISARTAQPVDLDAFAKQQFQATGARPKISRKTNVPPLPADEFSFPPMPPSPKLTVPICPLTSLTSQRNVTKSSSPFIDKENKVISSKGYYDFDGKSD